MGWLSEVGVCEHILRNVCLRPPQRGAGWPAHAEWRKGNKVPLKSSEAPPRFFQVVIDNKVAGEKRRMKGELEKQLAAWSEWQEFAQVEKLDDKE